MCWSSRDRRGITDTWSLHVMVQSERMSWCAIKKRLHPMFVVAFCGCTKLHSNCSEENPVIRLYLAAVLFVIRKICHL